VGSSSTLSIVNIGQLVTMTGPERPRRRAELQELSILENQAVTAVDGRITLVQPMAEFREMPGSRVLDARGCLVTPGLIDAHAHPVFAGNRANEYTMRAQGATYQEIAAAGGGIQSTVRATRAASEEDLLEQSLEHVRWMASHGTTTAEAKSGYGLDADAELKILRVIRKLSQVGPIELVPTFLGAHAVWEDYSGDPIRSTKEAVVPLLKQIRQDNLAEYADIFVERGYYDPECAVILAQAVQKFGLGLRMHVDQLSNSGGAALAARCEAITADHLEQTDEAGIDALAASDTIPVLLPASVYGLGLSRYPKARLMIDKGLPVVLATDFNPGSSPTASLPMVMSLACTQMRMTPAECLTACTVNAAASLGRLNDRGSIAVGNRADLVIWRWKDYQEIPYWIAGNGVASTIVNGQVNVE